MPVGLSDEKVQAFDISKPFTYQIEFDLPPQLTWRRPYKGLKVRQARNILAMLSKLSKLDMLSTAVMTFDACHYSCGPMRDSHPFRFCSVLYKSIVRANPSHRNGMQHYA